MNTTAGHCEVIPYRAEFREQVVELQTHLWSPDTAFNRRYLEWKYEHNPYIDEPLIYLARCDDRIVGMRGAFGTQWEIGKPARQFVTPYVDDLVILPAYRELGLHKQIMNALFTDMAARGYDYVFNLSGGRVTVLSSLAMGWKSAGAMQPVGRRGNKNADWTRLRKIVEELPYVWRFRSSKWLYSYCERHPFHSLDRAAGRTGNVLSEYIHAERAPRAKAMAKLVTSLEYDGRLRQVRDERFFAWRFLNPMHEYRFLYAIQGDRLLGYLVLQHKTSQVSPRVHIVDWEAETDSVGNTLLQTAIEHGRFLELVSWTAGLDKTRCALLEASGFAAVDTELSARGLPCAMVRKVENGQHGEPWEIDGRDPGDISNWELRMIYSMHG